MYQYCVYCRQIVFGIGLHDVNVSPKHLSAAAIRMVDEQSFGPWHAQCALACPDFPVWVRELRNWLGTVIQARIVDERQGVSLFYHQNSNDFIYLGSKGELLRFSAKTEILDKCKIPYKSLFQCNTIDACVDRDALVSLFAMTGDRFSELCDIFGCRSSYSDVCDSGILVEPLFGDLEDTLLSIEEGGFECEFRYEVDLPKWVAGRIASVRK